MLTIYPNPTEDYTTIVLPVILNSLDNITLYNAIGRTMPLSDIISGINTHNLLLQTKNLSAGTYMIKIVDGSKMYIGQFVKN